MLIGVSSVHDGRITHPAVKSANGLDYLSADEALAA